MYYFWLLLGLGLVEVLQWAFVEQLQDVNMSTASLSMLTESITTYRIAISNHTCIAGICNGHGVRGLLVDRYGSGEKQSISILQEANDVIQSVGGDCYC